MRVISLFLLVLLAGCSDNDPSEYTGRTISYDLYAGSDSGVPGSVEFRERIDASIDVIITLDQLQGEAMLPAHLHFGDLSMENNPQAAMLNDYDVSSGKSVTNLRQLADDSEFSFEKIPEFDGCIKVHLAHSGDDYNVIVAAGNIGANESLGFNLQSIAICSPDLN